MAETAKGAKKGGGARTVRRHFGVVMSGVLSSLALSTGLGSLSYAQQAPPLSAAVNSSAYFSDVKGALLAPKATQLPVINQVVQGQVKITPNDATAVMNIAQSSDKAVLNWNTFNVGTGAQVNFIQPSSSSVVLNRVLESSPSQIFGTVNANGQVFISNPSGIYFSPTAKVDVGGLVATTHSITDSDFMSGQTQFDRQGSSAAVVNEGRLSSKLGGYIALLAPEVQNAGVIVAQAGTVVMAAGERITLKFDQNNSLAGITTTPSAIAALIENRQAVQAPGGQIILSAVALNQLQSGVIKNSGTLEASSMVSRGGKIVLEADGIELSPTSEIRSNGPTGGGTVLIGGDSEGQGDIKRATQIKMDKGAIITANALDQGDGGKVVLYSDTSNEQSLTTVSGTLQAQGGANSGNGGHIETSGYRLNVSDLSISTQAPFGQYGNWLLDPYTYTIDSVAAANISAALVASFVTVDTNNASTNGFAGASTVGNANILVNSAITRASGSGNGTATTLTLAAGTNIGIYANISGSATNPLNVVLASRAHGEASGGVYIESHATIKTFGGNITIGGGNLTAGGYAIGAGATGMTLTNAQDGLAGVSIVGVLDATGDGSGASKLTAAASAVGANSVTAAALPSYASGGNISIRGQGSSTVSTSSWGVKLSNDAGADVGVITAGVGFVNITGVGGNGGNNAAIGSVGVLFDAGSYVMANQGTITLKGTQGTGANAYGIAAIQTGRLVGTNGGLSIQGDSLLLREGNWNLFTGMNSDIVAPILTCAVASNCAATTPTLTIQGAGEMNLWGDAAAWNTSPPANTANITNNGVLVTASNSVNLVNVNRAQALASFATVPHTLTSVNASNSTASYIPIYVQETITSGNYGNLIFNSTYLDSFGTSVTSGSGLYPTITGTATFNINNTSSAGTYSVYYTGGLNLTGGTGKYILSAYNPYTTFIIKPLPVTLTGGKTYDGTQTVSAVNLRITNVVNNDVVTLSGSAATGVASANATLSTALTTLTGLSLSNTNYTLIGATGSFAISPINVSVLGTQAQTKAYDGTTTATLTGGTLSAAFVGNDGFTLTQAGNFVTSSVVMSAGVPIPVTVIASDTITPTGTTNANNYRLIQPSGISAVITPRVVSVTGSSVADKSYDGTNIAKITGGVMSNVLQGDNLTLVQGGNFAQIGVGNGIAVVVSDILVGPGASNYTIGTIPNLSANITQAPLVIKANDDAKFSGQADTPTYNGVSFIGLVNGENPTVLGNSTFSVSRAAGDTETVGTHANVLSVTPSAPITNANYSVSYQTGSYSIVNTNQLLVKLNNAQVSYGSTPTYTVSSASYYSGGAVDLTTSTHVVNGTLQVDDSGVLTTANLITLNNSNSASGNLKVGTYPVSYTGLVNPNPNLSNGVVLVGTLSVTQKALNPVPTGISKVFDGNTLMTSLTFNLPEAITGDAVAVTGSGTYASYNATASANLNYTINNIKLTGADSTNYYLANTTNSPQGYGPTLNGSNGQITPLPINLYGITTYSASTAFTAAAGSLYGLNIVSNSPVTITGSGTLVNPNAGTTTLTSNSGLSIDNTNYMINSTGTITVVPAILTLTGTKVYDGTTTITGSALSASGVPGESFTLSGSGVLASKNAGTTTLGGVGTLSLNANANSSSGLASNYYPLTLTSNTITVSKAVASVVGSTSVFTYNGAAQSGTATTTGFINTDSVTVTGLASGTNAGRYASTLGITGADANNYQVAYTDNAITINPLPINVSVSVSKTYDASTVFSSNFVLAANAYSLASNAISGAVSVSSPNVANYNSVLSSTLVLSNANYSIGSMTISATINKANLTLSGSQTYNGGTAVLGSNLLATGVGGQTFSVTGNGSNDNLLSKNAGVQTLNTVTGLALGTSSTGLSSNYNDLSVTGSSVTIGAKPLSVTGETVTTKTYDALYTATINAAAAQLSGLVVGDAVNLSTASVTGTYASKNAGTGITVPVSGNAISGADASNYSLSQPVLTGAINKAPLGVSVTATYSKSTAITPSAYTLTGLQTGDTVTSIAQVTVNSANVSSNATNFVTGITSFVGTALMANYNLNTVANSSPGTNTTNAVTLNPYALSLGITKVYDASTTFTNAGYSLTGTLAGDTVPTISSGSATSASAGVGTYTSFSTNTFSLSNSNYSIGSVSATITKAPLGLSLTATYSGTTTVVPTSFVFTGLQTGDTVSSISSAVISNANVSGNGSTYFSSITLGANSASMSLANYTLSTTSYNATVGTTQNKVTLNPAPLGLNITATYSGTTTVVPTAATITGVLGSDHMTLSSVVLSDKNVSSNGTNYITDYTTAAGSNVVKTNYTLNPSYNWSGTDANSTNKVALSKATLVLSGTRTYDATSVVAGSTLSASGVNSETFTVTGLGDSSNLLTANASPTAAVLASLTGLSLGVSSNGGLAGNYNALSTTGSTYTITKAPLGISISAVYSGSTTVVPSTFTVNGLKGSDQFSSIASAVLHDANVSNNTSNYVVSISPAAGSSVSMSNYVLNSTVNTSGAANTLNTVTLSKAPLGITATGIYNGTQVVAPSAFTLTGLLGLDTVSAITSLNVTDKNVSSNGSILITGIALGTSSASMSMSNYVLNAVRNATPATNTSNDFNFIGKALSLSISKTYDSTANFSNANAYSLTGVLYANDSMPTIASGGATTSSANAANYNTLTTNTFALSNSNYSIGTVSAVINKAPLGISAAAVYSGGTTVVPTSFQLTGLQGAESVTSITSLVLSNANVANNTSNYVSAINVNVATANMANYVLNTSQLATLQQSNTNLITLSPAPLGINASGVFNSTLSLVPTSFALYGLLGADTVGGLTSLSVSNANVANNGSNFVTSIALGTKSSSMSLSNYILNAGYNAQPSTNTSNVFTMAAAPLSLSINKTYDGLAGFAVTNAYTFSGTTYAGDLYPTLVSGSGVVSSPNANSTPYSSFASNTFVLSNTNYAISLVSATINKAPLGVSITAPYSNSTTVVPSSFSLTGLQNNETVSGITNVTVNNANVANNATNYVSAINLGVHSAAMSMNNYSLTLAPNATLGTTTTNSVQLSPAPLGISGTGVYTGSTTLVPTSAPSVSGLFVGQTLNIASLVISNANVGANNYITQIIPNTATTTAVLSNYYLYPTYNNISPLTSSTNVFTVTPAALTLSGTMVYSASTAVPGQVLTANGVNGQTFSVTGNGAVGNISQADATTTPISLLNTNGLTLGTSNNGALASNYAALSSSGSSLSITKAPIGIAVVGTYTGSTTLVPSQAPVVTGLQGGQVFSIASVLVNSSQVLDNSSNYVKSITLNGAGSTASLSNYQLTQAYSAVPATNTSNSVTINPKPLTVNAVALGKTYDANTTATVTLGTLDAVAGQTVSFNSASALFANKNAGLQTVNVSGIGIASVANGNASNYTLNNTTATSSATISTATLTLTAVANSKVYDGTTTASAIPVVAGLKGTDSANATEVYANKNVGLANVLTPSAVVNDGNSGHNYQVVANTVNGTITPAPLVITAVSDAKFVTQTDTQNFAGVTYSGFVAGEGVAQLSAIPGVSRSNALVQDTGTYTGVLVPSAVTSSNYAISYVRGDYSIVPAGAVLVRTNNMSVTYGTALSFTPSVVSYMSPTGNTISNLTLSSRVGNQLTYSDNAQGSITFTLQALPVVPNGTNLSTSGNPIVGDYSIAATSYQTVLNHFTSAPVYVGALNITPLSLTLSAAPTKTYDGTTAMSNTNLSLSGVLPHDVVSVSGTGSFSTVNASASASYSLSGLGLSGADQSNYIISTGSNFSGNNGLIAPKSVTLTPVSVSKIYDATVNYTASAADLNALSAQLGVANDTVSTATLSYATSAVGTNKTLNLSAVTLSDGNNGHNYSVTFASNSSSSITPAPLTVLNTSVSPKAYDGNNTATLTGGTLSGVFAGDTVLLTQAGAFNDVNANTNIGVTASDLLSGSSANNYRLIQPQGLTGTITPKLISVSGTTVSDKVYDGLTNAQVSGAGTLVGLVGQETLGLFANAAFADANAGVAKTVNVSYALSNGTQGGLARNYSVSSGTTTATITKAPLTITVNDSSKFVTQSDPVGFAGVSYSGLVNGEFSSVITQGTLAHPTASCAVNPTCTDLVAGVYSLSASGFSSSNYQITTVPGQFSVLPAGKLVIQIPNVVNVYGASVNYMPSSVQYATNAGATINSLSLAGVTGTTYTYLDATGSSVSFNLGLTPVVNSPSGLYSTSGQVKAGSYTYSYSNFINNGTNLTPGSSPVILGSLTVNPLGLSLGASPSKIYDGGVSVTTPNLSLQGRLAQDLVTVSGSGIYASANAGQNLNYSISSLALAGADAGNYYLFSGNAFSSNNGVITQRAVTLTAPVVTKVYDGTNAAQASAADLNTLTNALNVQGNYVSSVALSYDNKNAGTQKSVSINSVGVVDGNNGQNFSITYASNSSSSISPAPLVLSALTNTKVYDGTLSSVAAPTVTGLKAGDGIQVTENYVSANVLGTNASVLVPSVVALNDGNQGANYSVSLNNALGSINPKPLGIAPAAVSKVYDAGVSIANVSVNLLDVVGADDVRGSASGAFSSSNVGTGLAYALNSLVLAGASAANYVPQANFSYTNTNGSITQAPITLRATKVYDGSTAMSTPTLSVLGVAGQTLTLTAGSAQANSANVNVASTLSSVTGLNLANGTGLASNYTVTNAQIGAVSITPAPLTITATDAVKNFDGTTAMTGATTAPSPLVLSGTLYSNASNAGARDSLTGGNVAFVDPSPGDKTKATVISGVVINDGNGGANYSITYVRNTTSTIVAPPPPPPTLSNAQVSTLSGAQITTLSADQIQNLTPPQIAALTLSQLSGLTGYQINLFNTPQVQAFTPVQIAAFVPQQVAALTSAQLVNMTPVQLSAFTGASVSLLTSAQLANFGAPQFQVMTPSQLSSLTPTQLSVLSGQQLQSLSGSQVSTLKPASVAALSGSQIAALTLPQVQAMTPGQLSALNSVQFASLSTPTVYALSAAQVGGLSPGVIAGLSTQLISGFSSTQIQGLVPTQMSVLTPTQLSALSPSQWNAINGSQFTSLSPSALSSLNQAQLTQLNAVQLQAMSASQMAALSPQQLTTFTPTQVAALGSNAVAGLSTTQVSSLGSTFLQSLSATQIGAIPIAQISVLNPAQLSAFKPVQISALTAPQVSALSPNQLASLQTSQLSALSPDGVNALSKEQVGVLSGNQLQAFLPSQISAIAPQVISSLSMGQFSALSVPQIKSLSTMQIGALQPSQIAVLSANALSAWSPAQLGSINPSQVVVLNRSQISSLSDEQMTGFTPTQLSAFSTVQLGFLSTSQISALSPSQLSGLSNAQLAILSVPPPPLQSQPISSGNTTSSSVGQATSNTPGSSSTVVGSGAEGVGGSGLNTGNAQSSSNSNVGSNLGSGNIANTSIAPGSMVNGAGSQMGLAAQLLSNASSAQTQAQAQAQGTNANQPSVPSALNPQRAPDLNSSTGNVPMQSSIQSAPAPVQSLEVSSPQGQGPPTTTNAVNPSILSIPSNGSVAPNAANSDPISPSSNVSQPTIWINVLKSPTLNTTGLIAVTLPQGSLNRSAMVSIPMPEQAIVNPSEVRVSLPSNESLPSWIAYNPQSQVFEVKAIPTGALPMTVVVESAGQRTLVLLSEHTSQ